MSVPNKLSQKALYWGPLFVGVVSLVAGAVLVRSSSDFEFGNRYADYQAKRETRIQTKLADVSPLETKDFKQSGLLVTGEPESNSRDMATAAPVLEEKRIVIAPPPQLDEKKKPAASKRVAFQEANRDDETSDDQFLPIRKNKAAEETISTAAGQLKKTPDVVSENLPDQDETSDDKKGGVSAENLPKKKPDTIERERIAAKQEETDLSQTAQKLAAMTDGHLKSKPLQQDEERGVSSKTEHKPNIRPDIRPEHTVLPSVIVAENGQFAGLEGGDALSGLNKVDESFEKLKISQLSESMAQVGLISQNVADKLVLRSVIFSARREATAFGIGGRTGLEGLLLSDQNHSRPLLLHMAQNFGVVGNETISGLEKTNETIEKLARQELIASTVEVGSGPLFAQTGIATSLERAARMRQRYNVAVLGRDIAIVARRQSYHGFDMALRDVAKQFVKKDNAGAKNHQKAKINEKISSKAGVDLAVLGHMNKDTLDPANRQGAHGNEPPRCSENFYNSLIALNELKIASLSKAVKPISRIDKTLPGRWYFKPDIAGVKRVCSRYKRYYSGRKKCIRWKKQVAPVVVTEGPDQKEFFKVASGLVAGRGRHAIVKSKSPGYWVINRVARDLKSYSLQKPHPAICTGALGMVNYFEGNLKKVKTHVDEVSRLSAQSDEFLNYWQSELQKTIQDNTADVLSSSTRNGKELSIEEQLDRIASQRHLTVFKEDFDISSIDLPLALGQVAIKIYGAEAAVEIKASDDILFALSESRKLLRSHRKRLPKRLYAVLYKFYSTVEASHYLRRSHERYQPLNEQLFGSLQDIRAAHQTHCVCQN